MNLLTQALISGLMSGAVYTSIGIGLVLIYRTARVLNLAHGESFVIAGLTAAVLTSRGMPMWEALGAAIVAALVFSTGLYYFVLRGKRDSAPAHLMLITLAGAFLVRGVMVLVAGSDPLSFPPLFSGAPLRFAGGAMPRQGLALVILGFAGSAGAGLFLATTRPGKELLATAEDPYAAELLGVNIERARLIAYGISGALGAITAILLVPLIAIDFQTGLTMTLRGFIAAAISGMSPMGVIASGLGLGLFEGLVGTYFGGLLLDPVMFLILILVAMWRSRGIRFGGGLRA